MVKKKIWKVLWIYVEDLGKTNNRYSFYAAEDGTIVDIRKKKSRLWGLEKKLIIRLRLSYCNNKRQVFIKFKKKKANEEGWGRTICGRGIEARQTVPRQFECHWYVKNFFDKSSWLFAFLTTSALLSPV